MAGGCGADPGSLAWGRSSPGDRVDGGRSRGVRRRRTGTPACQPLRERMHRAGGRIAPWRGAAVPAPAPVWRCNAASGNGKVSCRHQQCASDSAVIPSIALARVFDKVARIYFEVARLFDKVARRVPRGRESVRESREGLFRGREPLRRGREGGAPRSRGFSGRSRGSFARSRPSPTRSRRSFSRSRPSQARSRGPCPEVVRVFEKVARVFFEVTSRSDKVAGVLPRGREGLREGRAGNQRDRVVTEHAPSRVERVSAGTGQARYAARAWRYAAMERTKKKPRRSGAFSLNRVVERRGIEPLTFAMRTRRSPS
jgi:hypothetical protein